MRTILHILFLIISVISFGALIITDVIAYIQPSSVLSVFSLLSVAFPFLFITSFCLLLFWIIQKRWIYATALFLLLLISTPNLLKVYSFKPSRIEQSSEDAYSISSFNVHYFSFFEKKDGKRLGISILDSISKSKVDIICIQEMGYENTDIYTLEYIKRKLKDYPYMQIRNVDNNSHFQKAIATFSKYPIIAKHNIEFDSRYHCAIASDILINNDTLRVINCYLESNRLTEQEKEIYHSDDKENLIKRIYKKLGNASVKRNAQASKIASFSKQSKLKTIICGDINDVPTSYVYRTIRGDYEDTFLSLCTGMGNTFHEKIYRFRIDYIFTDKRITPLSFSIGKQDDSDQYPIAMSFKLN